MTPAAIARLNRQVEQYIPLARAAGVHLETSACDTLAACAPLTANGNPHGSAFGGSLYVAALVAGYAQTVLLAEQSGIDASVVVSHAQAEYLQPVRTDIRATVAAIDEQTRSRFQRMLQRRGRSRIDLTVSVINARIHAFDLHVRFAAIATPEGAGTVAPIH